MPFDYKRILVIGATSGIGKALADRFVHEGFKVIVVGRRQENLDQFVQEHGQDKAAATRFDISKIDEIPGFASQVTKSFPDLDCVFVNSGIQRHIDFSKPQDVNLDMMQQELQLDYFSFIALTKAFLPFLMEKEGEKAMIYTTSDLGLAPILWCPNYCASKGALRAVVEPAFHILSPTALTIIKAALHHFILVLREQLKNSDVKIIEILPPAVQTELHDEKNQPDLKGGHSIGIPLDQFTDEAWESLAAGNDQVAVGFAQKMFEKFELMRQAFFHQTLEA